MTVIKFTDGSKDKILSGSNNNYVAKKVYNAKLLYTTKVNMPKFEEKDTLIFTTDTHELFCGNGAFSEMEAFNSLLVFDSFESFPSRGKASKMYLDQGNASLYYYDGETYRQVITGEGAIANPLIGDLAVLETADKASIVGAINEVFAKIETSDMTTISKDVSEIKIDVAGIEQEVTAIKTAVSALEQEQGTLATKVDTQGTQVASARQTASAASNAVTNLANKVGDTAALETADKATIVAALNSLKRAVDTLGSTGGGSQDISHLTAAIASIETELNALAVADTGIQGSITSVAAKITAVESSIASMDLSAYAPKTSVYTKAEVENLISGIPAPEGFATEQALQLKADRTEVAALKAKVDNLVVITAAEKAEYDSYKTMIQALQDTTTIDNILSRLSVLEAVGWGHNA